MIEVYTNTRGDGDWVIVKNGDKELFSGHRLSVLDFKSVLSQLGHDATLHSITNEEMEELC